LALLNNFFYKTIRKIINIRLIIKQPIILYIYIY
jgi:hypothetical protein